MLKLLSFIFYFFFISHFNLTLPFFHSLLNQSSVLLTSFLKIAISYSILCFQNGSFLFMVWSVLTPTYSQTNNALALGTCLSSHKFLTGIHFSPLFTAFSHFVTKAMSLLSKIGISSFAASCIISIRRWWMGF